MGRIDDPDRTVPFERTPHDLRVTVYSRGITLWQGGAVRVERRVCGERAIVSVARDYDLPLIVHRVGVVDMDRVRGRHEVSDDAAVINKRVRLSVVGAVSSGYLPLVVYPPQRGVGRARYVKAQQRVVARLREWHWRPPTCH